MKNKLYFSSGKADERAQGNKKVDSEHRLPIKALLEIPIVPQKVLEIGCGNGWRLDQFREHFGAQCFGVDLSKKSCRVAGNLFPKIEVIYAGADYIPYNNEEFDCIILGSFMRLCDRGLLFKIASEVDRVCADGGIVCIVDNESSKQSKQLYDADHDIYSYNMQHSEMFLWNPSYSRVHHLVDVGSAKEIAVLKKEHSRAYSDLRPYPELC